MSKTEVLKEFHLEGTKNGVVSVGNIEKPYGANSSDVASIAVSLDGEEPDWKVHLPYSMIDDICASLQELKSKHG
jgi:hypothetical protein